MYTSAQSINVDEYHSGHEHLAFYFYIAAFNVDGHLHTKH